jgi:cadmium resistance protein CadD (predicted permease)
MSVAALPETIAAAAALFAGTNVDDLIVLAVLSASSRAAGYPRRWEIWAGQYLGFGVLLAVSLAAARGLRLIPHGWLWLLGLVPLGLGLGKLLATLLARRRGEPPPAAVPGGLAGLAALTITNGGDDVAAYAPVFAAGGIGAGVTIAVFAVGVAVWCLAGWWLVSHHRVAEIVRDRGHWIVPAVFVLVAVYIFWQTGLFGSTR